MHPRGSEKMKRLVTLCVLITILPFFSASFLFSVPFPLVFVWSVLISLLDSGQAWGHHFLWEGFTDPTTLTFQAGHSIYHPLPSLSTYMFVSIINSSLMLKTKFSMFCWILDLKSTHLFHIPNPSPSTKTTFNIVSPSRHSFPPLAHSTSALSVPDSARLQVQKAFSILSWMVIYFHSSDCKLFSTPLKSMSLSYFPSPRCLSTSYICLYFFSHSNSAYTYKSWKLQCIYHSFPPRIHTF